MTDKTIHKTIIIGSGPAGLTSAIYAGRANLKPIVFEGNQPGGQLTITTDVENYPGFPNGVMGPEMMDLFRDQAKKFGAECFFKHVTKVDFSSKPYKVFVGDDEFLSETIIISTGASARMLGLKEEDELMGYGISTCATCDGYFFKDKIEYTFFIVLDKKKNVLGSITDGDIRRIVQKNTYLPVPSFDFWDTFFWRP